MIWLWHHWEDEEGWPQHWLPFLDCLLHSFSASYVTFSLNRHFWRREIEICVTSWLLAPPGHIVEKLSRQGVSKIADMSRRQVKTQRHLPSPSPLRSPESASGIWTQARPGSTPGPERERKKRNPDSGLRPANGLIQLTAHLIVAVRNGWAHFSLSAVSRRKLGLNWKDPVALHRGDFYTIVH